MNKHMAIEACEFGSPVCGQVEKTQFLLETGSLIGYMWRLLRGSNASRKPSPSRLMHRIMKMMNMLGKIHIHQAPLWMKDCALVSMFPQEAVGG